jgi:hypothetical protein
MKHYHAGKSGHDLVTTDHEQTSSYTMCEPTGISLQPYIGSFGIS